MTRSAFPFGLSLSKACSSLSTASKGRGFDRLSLNGAGE